MLTKKRIRILTKIEQYLTKLLPLLMESKDKEYLRASLVNLRQALICIRKRNPNA